MTDSEQPLPKADFAFFCYSLGSQAMVHLGLAPNPVSGETEEDLVQAKYTIDLIEMLREKTEGNLTEEESSQLTEVLGELQRFYVVRAQQVQEAQLQQAGVDMNNIKAE